MDYMKDKAKSVISSLFGILLGSSRLPPPHIDLPKAHPSTHNNQVYQSSPIGLKTLLHSSSDEPQPPTTIITKPYAPLLSPSPPLLSRSSSATSTTSLSRSSSYLSRSSSISLDDLIGSDSGVHMSIDEDKSLTRSNSICNSCNTRKKSLVRKCCVKGRHYPPPIPSLARTGSLPGRMPWVMTRKYDNGKLIIREERAEHQEYIESRREDGRLIMKLVPFEDPICINRSINADKDGSGHGFDAGGEHGGSKGINKANYEVIEEEVTLKLPHIEEGVERDHARKLLLHQSREAEENDTFNLKAHQPSSATVSFSVCPMTTVP